jgi:hypothetical protein
LRFLWSQLHSIALGMPVAGANFGSVRWHAIIGYWSRSLESLLEQMDDVGGGNGGAERL